MVPIWCDVENSYPINMRDYDNFDNTILFKTILTNKILGFTRYCKANFIYSVSAHKRANVLRMRMWDVQDKYIKKF